MSNRYEMARSCLIKAFFLAGSDVSATSTAASVDGTCVRLTPRTRPLTMRLSMRGYLIVDVMSILGNPYFWRVTHTVLRRG